ncbi:MAG: hypothetical protein IPP71_10190 [Bacteroidetes bacterium]|nr:hypothetical protein [Bacteroidota bacterium]
MYKWLLVCVFCALPFLLKAQCPSFPFTSPLCGNINPGLSILGGDLFCYQGCVDFRVTTAIGVDSICINFGDNNYTTIYPNVLDTVVTHCYNILPSDSCPTPSPIALLPEARYYKTCPGGFSYNIFSTQVSVRFLPRPRFVLASDTICINQNVVIIAGNPPNACTNGFLNYPADYTWFLDGNPISNFTNIIANNYNVPAPFNVASPGNHIITLECTNTCGTSVFQQPFVVGPLPNPQIIPTNLNFCAGSQAILYAGPGYSSYLWSNGSTNDSIIVSAAANYTVTVTNNFGCSASTDTATTILISPNPPVISGSSSICAGATTTIDAGGGYSNYLWNTGATTQTITVGAGTYTVTVSAMNGCTSSSSFTINTSGVVSPVINTTSICGPVNGVLDAGSGYTSYLWSNGSTSQSISVSIAGTYTVTVTSGPNCSGTASATVVSAANPTPSITGNLSICQGDNTTLNAGSGFVQYLWNTGATTQSINVSIGGAYTVTVSNAAGCTGTDTHILTINPLPNPSISGVGAVCTGGVSTLDAGAGYSTYLWSTGANTQLINVTTSNTYTVTVTNASGCSNLDTFTFTVNPNPVPSISGQTSICSGSNAILDAGVYNSYLWNTGSTTNPLSARTPGVYTVTVTDGNGCTGTDDVTVSVNPNPIANIIPQAAAICAGQSTNLTANPGYTYLWSTGSTSQFIPVSTSGPFTVTITDINGCTDDTTISITVNSVPVPTITGDTIVCSGDVYSLNVIPLNYTAYLWSNGSISSTIQPTLTGIYTVTVTNASGCTGSISTNFSYFPKPSISIIGTDTVCQGTSAVLNAGSGYTYLWSNGSTNQTITVSSPNSYTVTVTDINGCKDTADIVFVVNPLPNPVITGDTITCANLPIVLNVGAGYQQYVWQDGSTDSTYFPTTSGIYTVTVTDGNGCTKSDQISLTVNPVPIPTVTSVGYFCSGSSVLINCGSGFSSYLWSTGDSTQNIYSNSVAWYSVIVTDINGCTGSDSIYIYQRNLPVVNISGDAQICSGQSSLLNAGAGFSSYLWSNGTTTQINSVTAAGSYIVTVTDSFGCNNQDIFSLIVDPIPTPVISGDSVICSGQSGTLTCNAGYQNYLWSNGEITMSINLTTSGIYSVTVTDLNGCSASVQQMFTVNTLPNPVIPGSTTLCNGSSTVLSPGTGFAGYLWSTGASTPNISVSSSGLYEVTVTDANGCTSTAAITLTFYPLPTPVITGDPSICNGETSTLNAGSGYLNYIWSDGTLNQFNNITSSGTYLVTVTDSNFCVGTSLPFTVTVLYGHANITYSSPLEFCEGGSVTLVADSAMSYLWSDGSTSSSITVNQSGQYLVTVVDLNGCPAISSLVTTYEQLNPVLNVDTSSILICGEGIKFQFKK